MSVNFPPNPQPGDSFPSEAGTIYIFDGEKWVSAVPNPDYADIQGATGPQGQDGQTGATGPQGPAIDIGSLPTLP